MLGTLQKEREYRLLEYIDAAPLQHCLTHADLVADALDMTEAEVFTALCDLRTYGLIKENGRLTEKGNEFLTSCLHFGRIATEAAFERKQETDTL